MRTHDHATDRTAGGLASNAPHRRRSMLIATALALAAVGGWALSIETPRRVFASGFIDRPSAGPGSLRIEVRVRPEDIDLVQIGQSASVKLHGREVLPATLERYGPDLVRDASTGQPYYLAWLSVADGGSQVHGLLRLPSGLPVEVSLETGSRSLLQDLVTRLLPPFGGPYPRE